MARFTYIGTPDDTTDAITAFGVEFERGKTVTVPDDHPQIDKFKANQTFAETRDEVKEAEAADEAAERLRLTEELDRRGIAFGARSGNERLQRLLDEALLNEAKA